MPSRILDSIEAAREKEGPPKGPPEGKDVLPYQDQTVVASPPSGLTKRKVVGTPLGTAVFRVDPVRTIFAVDL